MSMFILGVVAGSVGVVVLIAALVVYSLFKATSTNQNKKYKVTRVRLVKSPKDTEPQQWRWN